MGVHGVNDLPQSGEIRWSMIRRIGLKVDDLGHQQGSFSLSRPSIQTTNDDLSPKCSLTIVQRICSLRDWKYDRNSASFCVRVCDSGSSHG